MNKQKVMEQVEQLRVSLLAEEQKLLQLRGAAEQTAGRINKLAGGISALLALHAEMDESESAEDTGE